MKQKFKLISMFLSIVMVLSLTACGNKNISGSVAPNNNAENSETPVAEEVTYESGSTNGGVYTNEFIGIGCELDENWTYFSAEQIAELSGMVQDSVNSEEVVQLLESGKQVFDMYATTSDGLASINITIQDLGVIYGATLDEETYVDKSTETTIEALESSGFANVNLEKAKAEFAGAERTALIITGTISEMPVYEEVICIKKGKYMAFITFCSFNENITVDLASLFYAL